MTSARPPNPRCARSALLKLHQPLVQRIARRMKAKVPANVDIDDLVQAGMMGLDQALNGYEAGHGTAFDTYASRRIQGAMLDELRQQDDLPRLARGRLRQIRAAVHKLEHALGRSPRAFEISRALGWTLKELHDAMVQGGAPGIRLGDGDLDTAENEASLAEIDVDDYFADEHADPARALQRRQEKVAVNSAFAGLAESERALLSLLYREDKTQQAVADILGVTSSRVCQMHAAALTKLRNRVATKEQAPMAAPSKAETEAEARRPESPQVERRAPHALDWLDQAAQQCLL